MDRIREAGPAEPEQPDGEGDGADDDGREAPLGDLHAVVARQFLEVEGLVDHDVDAAQQLADNEADEGQAADTGVHAVDLGKHDRVGAEEQVHEAVDERHVQRDQEDNGLAKQHAQRPHEVLVDELEKVDLDLLLLGVDGEVLGLASDAPGLGDEDLGRVGLLQEEREEGGQEAHDGGDVHGPAPAQVAVDDETADDGRREGPAEHRHGERRDGDAALAVVVHVGETRRHDRQGSRGEEAGEEPRQHQCLVVLGHGGADGEDGKPEHGYHQRLLTAHQFRPGAPGDGAECEA